MGKKVSKVVPTTIPVPKTTAETKELMLRHVKDHLDKLLNDSDCAIELQDGSYLVSISEEFRAFAKVYETLQNL